MNKITFEKTLLWTKRPSMEQVKYIKEVQQVKKINFDKLLSR